MRSPLLYNRWPTIQHAERPGLRIRIRQGGGGRNGAQGILIVRATGRQPTETVRLLKTLGNTYLQAAQQQRQQRLADGLNFLNKQAPELEARNSELQNELAQFRIRHSLLEPTEEGLLSKPRALISISNCLPSSVSAAAFRPCG